MKHLHLIFLLTFLIGFHTPSTQAFLGPKLKTKIRQEQKARREDPECEYIYYNKVKNTFYGSIGLPIGFVLTINGFFNPHLTALETSLFSAAGPITMMGSIKALNNGFQKGPAVIINEWGIITDDHGLTLWEEIKQGTITYDTICTITLELYDGGTVFINCDMLNTTVDRFLLKINRFKKLRLSGNSFTLVHEDTYNNA